MPAAQGEQKPPVLKSSPDLDFQYEHKQCKWKPDCGGSERQHGKCSSFKQHNEIEKGSLENGVHKVVCNSVTIQRKAIWEMKSVKETLVLKTLEN